MAADSSINETDGAAPPGEDKPSALREPLGGPLRPPRPAKRASGSVRIPLPSAVIPGSRLNGSARPEVAGTPPVLAASSAPSSAPAVLTSLAPSSAPAVATTDAPAALVVEEPGSDTPTPVPTAYSTSIRPPAAIVTPAVPNDPAANLEFALTRRSSAAPPPNFDSSEVDPSDRAPAAPFTPWRHVPPLEAPPGLDSSPPTEAKENHDHEDTIVGQVAKNLLDLSSEDEDEGENTRAYQAPQELIDLARRQREERQAHAGSDKKRDRNAAFRDSLPPAGRRDAEQGDQSDIRTATVPLASSATGDGAPAVEISRPAPAKDARKGSARAKQPSLSELAREISERRPPESPRAAAELRQDVPPESALSLSGYRTPWLTRGRVWALLISVFIVVGYALARWRGLDLLQLR